MIALEPLGGSSAANSFSYWGERSDWLVALSHHRDSDALERSNWEVINEDFLQRFENALNEDWATESFSNWAVGWSEVLLVRPGTPVAEAAVEWAARLSRYGVADEEHYGMVEWDEEWCVRCDRGTRKDHDDRRAGGSLCPKFRSETDADEIKYAWHHRRDRYDGS